MLVFLSAKAQKEKQDAPKPKVGLVLSGGGAKGLAHIGVLKVIDSLGIKIDYVAGTSMGSIIGGLYASGYSGKQLDAIFQNIDFDTVINDDLPRSSTAFSERDDMEKYAVKLPFNDFKIRLPSALSKGHNTYSLFIKLLLHVNAVDDFSKLPIPFFCVATNIENGQQVILDSGNLTQSLMASSALPTLFQPVTINNDLLIDGGVVNNYPIEELRAKGMDVIIGVKGNKDYTRAYVLGKLKLKSGEKISYKDFKKGIDNLVATNNFEAFEYELKDTPESAGYNLVASVKETDVNAFLKLGVHYDDLYKSGALVNLTKKQLLFKNDVGSLDFIVGDNVRYNFEYNPNNDFLFEKTDYISLFGNLKLDTYDNKYFPKKGVFFEGNLHVYLDASGFVQDFQNFSIAKADMGYAVKVSLLKHF